MLEWTPKALASLVKQPLVSGIVAISIFNPTQIQTENIILMDEGLTVSIPRAAPPRALLEDEYLQAEIAQEVIQPKIELREIEPLTISVQTQSREIEPIHIEPLKLEKKSIRLAYEEVERKQNKETVPEFGDTFSDTTRLMQDSDRAPARKDETGKPSIDVIDRVAQRPVFKKISPTDIRFERNSSAAKVAKVEDSVVKERAFYAKEAPLPNGPASVSGYIELADGLALLDSESLKVQHQIAGVSVKEAKVDIQNGTFEIDIESARQGSVAAEIRDDQGFLIGKGQLTVMDLTYDQNAKSSGNKLIIKPFNQDIHGVVVSGYSDDQTISGAEVTIPDLALQETSNKKGQFAIKGLLAGSQVLIKAQKQKHWGTLAMASADYDQKLVVHQDKMVAALLETIDPKSEYRDGGIIWGRVTKNGQAVGGVKVEVTSTQAIGPIYFNNIMIPDTDMTETSENGYFAFINVDEGLQIVKAQGAGLASSTRVSAVERMHVSHIPIEAGNYKKAQAYFYDAMTGSPVSAEVKFSGSETAKEATMGVASIKYQSGFDLFFLEADAGADYYYSRQTVSRNVSHVNFPMVRKQWLRDFLAATRVNTVPNTGLVVGFVKGQAFEVLLTEQMMGAEVHYFDSQGRAVMRSEEGTLNGGFVIANVPEGLHTILISPQSQSRSVSQVVYSHPAALSIIQYQF